MIKKEYTRLQRVLEGASLFFLIAPFVLLSILWDHIPENIPVRHGPLGDPVAWMGKPILIALPLISLVLYGFFTFISLFPGKWNIPKAEGAMHERLIYRHTRTLLLSEKLVIAMAMAYIILAIASGWGLGIWFLPVMLAGIIAPPIVYFVSIHKGKQK